MFASILFMLAPLVSPLVIQEGAAEVLQPVTWQASDLWIAGAPFEVSLNIIAPADGMQVPLWALTPAAFDVDGKALGKRPKGMIALAPGQVVETRFDLTAAIAGVAPKGTFALACALTGSGAASQVLSPVPLEEKLNFMTIPEKELGGFEVIMLTNRGAMWFELWPCAQLLGSGVHWFLRRVPFSPGDSGVHDSRWRGSTGQGAAAQGHGRI